MNNMGDENVHFMEVVSDTDAESTDTTVNSGPTDDEESVPEPRPLLSEIIRSAEERVRGDGRNDDHLGAAGGVANSTDADDEEEEDDEEDDEEEDADATQPGLDAPVVAEKEPSPKQEQMKVSTLDLSSEEDGQICTICFEPWTSSSEHRLVSLRCGHLFGRSCISKWLKGQGSRCPQCNARARKSEIRPIYARTLKVLDTSERDRALRELERESEMRKKAEMECAHMRLKYDMVTRQCELLKRELVDAKSLLSESRSQGSATNQISKPTSVSFKLCSIIELSGGCRVLDCNEALDLMIITQPSTTHLFKGFGLRKISVPVMRTCEYVHLHQRAIKDVAFHEHNGLILTASFDKTLKLTNAMNNSVVQTYNVDCEAWSCAWDLDDPCYFYAGVRTGQVFVYDIRVTDRYIEQIDVGEASPVIAIQYIKRNAAAGTRRCGPVVSHLSSCFYYEKRSPSSFLQHQLPLEGKFTSLSYESTTSHLLASCRPSIKHPRVTHTLCSISYEERNSFQCNFVQNMNGGGSQAQLSRSKLSRNPVNESSVLVCAGDEESRAALIWDGSTGATLCTLKAESPVLDMTMFQLSQTTATLATLTDKVVRTYCWSQH